MPSLIDKLLDIIGLLPIGKLLRIGRIARIIQRIRQLQARAGRLRDLLRAIRARLRDAAERLERFLRRGERIREQAMENERRLRRAGASEDEIRRARAYYEDMARQNARELDEAAAAQRRAAQDERNLLQELAANQDLVRQILTDILGMILPMDLLRSLATLGGMAVAAGFAAPSDRRGSITGSLALGAGASADGQVLVLSKGGVPVQAALTGPAGDFAFDGLPEGDYQVLACTQPMQLRWVKLRSERQDVLLESGVGFPAEIRVVHGERPLEGVTLAVCELREGVGVPAAWLADLAGDGSFCTRFLGVDSRFVLLAYAGYGLGFTLLAPRIAKFADMRMDAVLRAGGGAIAGRVADADGKPVAGAKIEVLPARGGQRDQDLERQNCARVFTDARGEFEARHLDAGEYLVVCAAPGCGGSVQQVTLAADGRHGLDLRLERLQQSATLVGQLVNPHGAPSAGYAVAFTADGRPTGMSAFAGADGLFQIEGLAAGHYQLAAQGESVGVTIKTDVPMHGDCPTETLVQLAQPQSNLSVAKSAYAKGERIRRSAVLPILPLDLLADDEDDAADPLGPA